MRQEQAAVTFEVRIENYNDFTCQGKLITKGNAISFRSDLELLLTINKLLCGDQSRDYRWNGMK